MAKKVLSAADRRKLDGMSLSPGEGKIVTVGGERVLVQRNKYVDKYGNPVHRVSRVDSNGNIGKAARGNGSISLLFQKLQDRKK